MDYLIGLFIQLYLVHAGELLQVLEVLQFLNTLHVAALHIDKAEPSLLDG